jgi:hypothetical protein
MKRIWILTLLLMVFMPGLYAQEGTAKRVVLLGNTGGDTKVVKAIWQTAALDTNTIILFLGNDVANDKKASGEAVKKQLAVLQNTGARVIFVPGHEEWKQGLKALKARQKLLEDFEGVRVDLLPKDGCPGPKTVDIGDDVVLLILDTEWWLLEGDKPGMESDCPCKNEQQVLDKVEDILADNRDKLIIVAGHHSFRTTGIRSGYFGPKQHIFPLTDIRGLHNAYLPLPGIGSLYPIMRSVAISRQDMAHRDYQHMISSLDIFLSDHPFLIRAAAHEHVLELYENNNQYYLTSGAGQRAGRVVKTKHTPFAGRKEGFAVIDVTRDKKAKVSFFQIESGKVHNAYQKELFDFRERPAIKPAEEAVPVARQGDSVTAAVYASYGEASGLKRLLLGRNYRKEWSTPVSLPELHLANDPRAFKIEGQGGGKQTTSIRLEDKDGRTWSLRTIVKDPEKVLPPNLRETVAQDILKDLLSSSHPFGPVVSNGLSDAAGVVRPRLEYYYVPDDTALGYYRPAFANTIAALEERQPSRYNEETEGTWHVVNEHLEKWKDKVDARSYLRARLLDILLGDFDRHYEQWKWGIEPQKDDSSETYYAIPKDRDQALFNSDGLLLKLGANQGMAYLKGLKKTLSNIKSLGFVSRDIDAFFLNELSAEDWRQEIRHITATLTDKVIHTSVQALPDPAYQARGKWIEERIRSRRDALPEAGMKFYRFLAEQVNVVGSDKTENFDVSNNDSGVALVVSNKKGEEKYHRVFHPKETKEVYLYGLGNSDTFRIASDVPRGIRFRAIGGKGKDVFDMQGKAKNFVYDNADGDNTLLGHRRTTNMISNRRDVNDYTFRENHYSSFSFPAISLGYNIDDGFMAGIGLHITKRGFRSDPYTIQHRLSTLIAFQNQAYQIRYNGTFNDAWRHFDVLANASLLHPALQNFFGMGNETTYDTSLPLKYYRVRYSYASADLLLRKRAIHNRFSVSLGPSIFYYWNNNDRNTGRILDYAADYGLDSTRIFSPKFYAGGKLAADFNSIDNVLLPTRGLHLSAEGVAQTGLNESTLPLYRAQGDISLFAPLSDNKRFILALRGGGGHIFSDGYEYWQLLTIGANNYLRGFRKNRFSGTSAAYGSAELRWRIVNLRSRILPGEFGLIGFQDVGRVWLRGEESAKWHAAYGGGFYFTPFNSVLISVLGAKSEEEQLINISIGTGLNLVF